MDIPGSVYTEPGGISDAGYVTGVWQDSDGERHAFVATPVGRVRECNEENNFYQATMGQPGEIRGSVFNDLNGDGVRDIAPTLLISDGQILRYNATNGAFIDLFLKGGDLQTGLKYGFGPDGDLYVGDGETARILRYNGTTGEFMDVVASDRRLKWIGNSIVFGKDGNILVTNGNFVGPVMRFNRVTGAYMGDFIPLGSGGRLAAGEIAFGPDGNLSIASIRGDDRILQFDGTTGAFIETFITLPPHRSAYMSTYGPPDILFGPDGDYISPIRATCQNRLAIRSCVSMEQRERTKVNSSHQAVADYSALPSGWLGDWTVTSM